ncbi:MAG TPA: hypothetical protein DEB35_00095 [Desulfuromonas sp.]|nr:hypothetical protein [Desulfuromonas sp.]HBT81883.1 hypothetical protein [Desulfuromonas sp.]
MAASLSGNDDEFLSAELSIREEIMADKRILVVEDEIELAEVLAFNLTREGWTVLVAHGGLSASRIIGTERPDLILLDLMLPDLNGRDVCAMVRRHPDPAVAATPIIMLTAMTSIENREAGLRAGATLYLSKPFVLREVIRRVRELLERSPDAHAILH